MQDGRISRLNKGGEVTNNALPVKKKHNYLCISHKVRTFATLLKRTRPESVRRDGRVVDYTGLENRRAERHRGFESLSLRKEFNE